MKIVVEPKLSWLQKKNVQSLHCVICPGFARVCRRVCRQFLEKIGHVTHFFKSSSKVWELTVLFNKPKSGRKIVEE